MPYSGLIRAVPWFDTCHILVVLGLRCEPLRGIIAELMKGDFQVHLGIVWFWSSRVQRLKFEARQGCS